MKRVIRDEIIKLAVAEVHRSGVKPTSRNVLLHLDKSKTMRDVMHGMNSRDVNAFRDAMRSVGYVQKPNGRWHWPEPLLPVGLDEVRCDYSFCAVFTLNHTYGDHRP